MYSEIEIFEKLEFVFEQIRLGKSVRQILPSGNNIISSAEFYDLIANSKEKKEQYARACEEREEKIFDEIIEIADDKSEDTLISDEGKPYLNNEFVQRSRLRIDARKWQLSKMNPKKYGEKMDLTTGGDSFTTKPEPISISAMDYFQKKVNEYSVVSE